MKRIIIFIGLKVGEIIGLYILGYLFWLVGSWVKPGDPIIISIINGALMIFVPLMCFALLAVVVSANWEWAKRIARKAGRGE